MTDQSDLQGSVVPFCRQWHIIHEMDLIRFAADHAMLRRLCNDLEACADALPYKLSPEKMRSLCVRLRAFVIRYDLPDDVLLKTLFGRDGNDPLTHALINHVQTHNAADAAHAHDLVEALDPTTSDYDRFSVEALAYMLRCFFDGCRRAMDFEELTILMLGGNRLTPGAKTVLVNGLSITTAI